MVVVRNSRSGKKPFKLVSCFPEQEWRLNNAKSTLYFAGSFQHKLKNVCTYINLNELEEIIKIFLHKISYSATRPWETSLKTSKTEIYSLHKHHEVIVSHKSINIMMPGFQIK